MNCPRCGYCPSCGRGGYSYRPFTPEEERRRREREREMRKLADLIKANKVKLDKARPAPDAAKEGA